MWCRVLWLLRVGSYSSLQFMSFAKEVLSSTGPSHFPSLLYHCAQTMLDTHHPKESESHGCNARLEDTHQHLNRSMDQWWSMTCWVPDFFENPSKPTWKHYIGEAHWQMCVRFWFTDSPNAPSCGEWVVGHRSLETAGCKSSTRHRRGRCRTPYGLSKPSCASCIRKGAESAMITIKLWWFGGNLNYQSRLRETR